MLSRTRLQSYYHPHAEQLQISPSTDCITLTPLVDGSSHSDQTSHTYHPVAALFNLVLMDVGLDLLRAVKVPLLHGLTQFDKLGDRAFRD